MARQDILLIGLEYNSLRILEVSLRKAGFMVASVTSYSDALEQMRIAAPDLVIVDSVRDADAFEFASLLKRDFRNTPVILISANKEINTRIRALEIGIDDYLVKPIYIKEIIARIKIHLQKREQKRVEDGITAGFIGSLSDIGLYDIVQTIELNRKSGILEIKGKVQDGRIFFKNGQIVQASVGKLRGEYAVYRMLTFGEGIFKMSFLDIDVEPEINKPNNALIMEGMRRLDEYMKYTEQLPPLTTRLEIDTALLSERLKDIPDNVNKVLKLIDSERSINDIVDMSELDELETLKIISALYFDGIVYDIFARKPESVKKVSSTLPEPVFAPSLKAEENQTEGKRPPTSETWAASIFEKESKEVVSEPVAPNIGDTTIADSGKLVEIREKPSESPDMSVESEVPDKKDELSVKSAEISVQKTPDIPVPVASGTDVGPASSVISDGTEKKSPKEQLIENTLIENVTLSTSSYVKGSLLGKKERKLKSDKKSGFPFVLLVLILVISGAGIYLGYRYYISQATGRKETTIKESKTVSVAVKDSEGIAALPQKKEEIPKKEEEKKEKPPETGKTEEEEAGKEVAVQDSNTEEAAKSQKVIDDSKKEPLKSRGGEAKDSEPVIDMEGYNGFMKSALNLYKSGNSKGAKEELKQALIKNPKGFEALTLLGQIDLDGNRIKSAITYFKRALSYNGKYAPAYFYLGTCYQLEGNNESAKKMYQKYLTLAPNGEFANDVRAIISDLK